VRLVAVAVCALLLAAPVAASLLAAPDSGKFTGTAGAGFHITFTVKDGKTITSLRTDFEATIDCGPPAEPAPYFTFPAIEVSGGDFHGSTTVVNAGGTSPTFTIKGSFTSATKASGTIHESFSYPKNALPPCSETDTFKAER
jgi:hypothetical protein